MGVVRWQRADNRALRTEARADARARRTDAEYTQFQLEKQSAELVLRSCNDTNCVEWACFCECVCDTDCLCEERWDDRFGDSYCVCCWAKFDGILPPPI